MLSGNSYATATERIEERGVIMSDSYGKATTKNRSKSWLKVSFGIIP